MRGQLPLALAPAPHLYAHLKQPVTAAGDGQEKHRACSNHKGSSRYLKSCLCDVAAAADVIECSLRDPTLAGQGGLKYPSTTV